MLESERIVILVVDDNEASLYASSRILKKAGFNVLEAGTGLEALEMAQQQPGLIILDLNLPDIDGFEVCKRLKEDAKTSGILVLHLTAAYRNLESKINSLESGADAYLTQPVDDRELIATIHLLFKYKNAEKRAAFEAIQWKTTFDTISDGICLVDQKGIVQRFNKSFKEHLGKEDNDIYNLSYHELLYDKEAASGNFQPSQMYLQSINNQRMELMSKNRWFSIHVDMVPGKSNKIEGYILIMHDITERKRSEDELAYLSFHDVLTGLYNRRFFENELTRIDTKQNLPISIIMCDINGLKLINDSFGHDSGDALLQKAAETIKKSCREEDMIARIGGDEFVVLLPKTASDEAARIANCLKEFASKETVSNVELSISYGYDTKNDDKQAIVEVMANAENHMYRHKLYERSSMRSKVIGLIKYALFEKSNREAIHSNTVSIICEAIATQMKLDKANVEKMRIAGLLHDIGKIGIDEEILNKPGKLSDDEWEQMRRHPEKGWRILSSVNEFSELAQFVYNHHEKWDGSGYPNGLKREKIPLEARIISVADAFDAMTSARSYRKVLSRQEAIHELTRCSGTQFDPEVIDVFVNGVCQDGCRVDIKPC